MKEHTDQRLTFNRTLLRRGYCVSERCPTALRTEQNATFRSEQDVTLRPEQNATLRFERCVAKYARRYALTPQLKKLRYCTTHQQRREEAIRAPNEAQMLFLYTSCAILLLNVIGTLYHSYKGDDSNKNSFLMAWSFRSNWARFTKIERSDKFAALAPLQFTRLLLQWIVIGVHTCLSHFLVFVHNAEDLEKRIHGVFGTMARNGTSLVQIYILISCFLTGYKLLLAAKTTGLSATMLVKWILKRLARILPVYLLVIGYVASWWPRAHDGPQFTDIVGRESQICRNKFWYHVLFINNIVDPANMCLLQTWAFAVDMQLYIFSTLLTILLMRLKVRAIPILAFLLAASAVLNALLAYVNGWEPMVKIFGPETLRHLFRNNSFCNTHISTWGNLPSCFLGLLIAHIYFEKVKIKAKVGDEPQTSDYRTRKSVNENNGPNKIAVDKNNRRSKEVGENNEAIRNRLSKNNGPPRYRVDENNGANRNGVHENSGPTTNEVGEINGTTKNGVDESYGRSQNGEENNGPTRNGVSEKKGPSKNGVATKIQKQLLRNGYIYAIPSIIAWVVLSARIESMDSPVLMALYVGVEPIVIILLAAVFLIQMFIVGSKSFLLRFWSWHGWHALGRLAYCVTLLHWCINLTIVAGRSEAIGTSYFYIFEDFLATIFYSYLLALPVCLLVELPAQKFLDLLISVPSSIVRF